MFAVPASALAQDVPEDDETIIVTGEHLEDDLSSSLSTSTLVDTPQTVTVISDQTLRRQNLLTLRDALSIVPGITFTAGEGGGGYGDRINLRGYSADNDVTVDGVRDTAQYSRTDPFNLQQIEVYNGANSVFNGSGSVGGTINLASKEPQSNDLTILQGAIGTHDYYRGSIDTNLRVSDFIAVRLNAMAHRNDFPGRDVEEYERWGVAPAITLGIGGPTSLTLAYVHQRDDNVPIYGVPYFQSLINDGPFDEVDDSDYFGNRNIDEQQTNVDRATAIFRHDFGGGLSVRNLNRWQRVHQYSQTSAPQGTFCLSTTGLQPVGADGNAAVGLPCPPTLPPGFYMPSGPRGLVRDQFNELLHSQVDVRFETGSLDTVRNTLVIGGQLAWEDFDITTAQLFRFADGTTPVPVPIIDLSNPDTVYTGPINYTVTSLNTSARRSRAIYAFDTIEFGPMFELNGGLRLENNRSEFRALPAPPPIGNTLTDAQRALQISEDNLFSYRFGGVFHPVEDVSIYAAYGNSRTPPAESVRVGCGAVTAPGAADPCDLSPERAKTYELGAKADLFGGALILTGSVFRNERTNFSVASNDPAAPTALQVLDGRARVDGVALGVSGNITPAWSIFANYTYLDAEVRQSVSDFCLGAPGSPACPNSPANPDPQAGQELLQTPRHSGSMFTTYRLPFGLEIGYGFTYQGSIPLNNRTLAQATQFRADDYLTHRAYLAYQFGNGVTAQLNVQNLTDERYFTNVRNNVSSTTGAITGGWAIPGEERSAVLSVFYSF